MLFDRKSQHDLCSKSWRDHSLRLVSTHNRCIMIRSVGASSMSAFWSCSTGWCIDNVFKLLCTFTILPRNRLCQIRRTKQRSDRAYVKDLRAYRGGSSICISRRPILRSSPLSGGIVVTKDQVDLLRKSGTVSICSGTIVAERRSLVALRIVSVCQQDDTETKDVCAKSIGTRTYCELLTLMRRFLQFLHPVDGFPQ